MTPLTEILFYALIVWILGMLVTSLFNNDSKKVDEE
jgi:hypothetical protein